MVFIDIHYQNLHILPHFYQDLYLNETSCQINPDVLQEKKLWNSNDAKYEWEGWLRVKVMNGILFQVRKLSNIAEYRCIDNNDAKYHWLQMTDLHLVLSSASNTMKLKIMQKIEMMQNMNEEFWWKVKVEDEVVIQCHRTCKYVWFQVLKIILMQNMLYSIEI